MEKLQFVVEYCHSHAIILSVNIFEKRLNKFSLYGIYEV